MPTPLSRRSLLQGALLASSGLLAGAVLGPPVRLNAALYPQRPTDPGLVAEFSRVGDVFRAGMRAGFRTATDEALAAELAVVAPHDQPIAWEGAGMATAFLERNTRSDRSWRTLVAGLGAKHQVSLALGLGWALSWLGREVEVEREPLPPLVAWRVLDAYGFRDGFVGTRRYAVQRRRPPRITGFARSVWLEGLGRSLWYTTHADVATITPLVTAFSPTEQPSLWKGLGVAATFIGTESDAALTALVQGAGADRVWLAVGAALACRTRRDEGAMTARQEAPCRVLAGSSPALLAAETDAAEAAIEVPEAATGGEEPATGQGKDAGLPPRYGRWLQELARRLS